ncbi:MAG: FMN-binding protein [Spirochaetaceae bacterium]|nr:FMN-binding protein [Spirochaetaceae bacterium]
MKQMVVLMALAVMLGSCKLPADIAGITVQTPDLSKVADGTWRGICNASLIKAQVAVTVQSGRIEAIIIERHEHGRGGKAEAIVDRVIAQQSLAVDVVSGATGSSKVILKAIEQALAEGSR